MSLPISKYHFSAAEFERMGEAGVFKRDARLELIEGEIIETSPIGSPHAACVNFLSRFLNRTVGDIALVSTQNPIRLDDFSEPEPDIALLRLRDDFYRDAHPTPADVLLIIEVADTTLGYDRQVKMPLYARAGVAEAWIVNLTEARIEIYSGLAEGAYQTIVNVPRGEEARAHTVAGLSVGVAEVLGEASE
ncbi:MAG TPA: Uma2 family endonuclease [Pyrinomonadaceae bacterium]|nr:Uma2 family endonuclease [Pyrinomonadaceae bacterium]